MGGQGPRDLDFRRLRAHVISILSQGVVSRVVILPAVFGSCVSLFSREIDVVSIGI